MGTIDAHLLAIDAKSGGLIWDTTVASSSQRYSITHSPLVVKDKVIVGTPAVTWASEASSRRSMRRRERGVALLHDPGAW